MPNQNEHPTPWKNTYGHIFDADDICVLIVKHSELGDRIVDAVNAREAQRKDPELDKINKTPWRKSEQLTNSTYDLYNSKDDRPVVLGVSSDEADQILSTINSADADIEYACLHLRVPHPSLPDWLNAMIRTSLRNEWAGKALPESMRHGFKDDSDCSSDEVARDAIFQAESLLAEVEAERRADDETSDM